MALLARSRSPKSDADYINLNGPQTTSIGIFIFIDSPYQDFSGVRLLLLRPTAMLCNGYRTGWAPIIS